MEQKKGFFEDGGGFDRIWDGTIGRLDNAFKRFGKTRLATLLGMVLVTCMVVCLICDTFVGEVSLQLRNRDLRGYLQHDAGLPEAAGISEREFDMVSDVLDNVADGWALMWTVDHFKDDYYLKPFSEAEITLLDRSPIPCLPFMRGGFARRKSLGIFGRLCRLPMFKLKI